MHNLAAYAPFADSGFDELLRGCFRPVRVDKAPATIRMDVVERDNAYVVNAEIPGVAKDDIQVSIEGNQVTIAAEVKKGMDSKDGEAGHGERVLRSERFSGAVYRSFVLPVELDEAASEAKYENGVLELNLAKKPTVAGRKLTIQ